MEEKYSFKLPKDYRWFIMNVGNVGAGPYYGILPLGGSTLSWVEQRCVTLAYYGAILIVPVLLVRKWALTVTV